MQKVLHYQADRIELVLASHKVPGRVTGGKVTPRMVRYHLTTPLGVRVRQVASLAEELALSLGAQSCRVYRQDGQVQIEVPRSDGQVIRLQDVCNRLPVHKPGAGRPSTVPPVTAVLGLDGDGAPLLLCLPSPNVAHVLLAGTTGSGKTALARTMVASLATYNSQRQLQFVLVDPKGRGLMPFEGLPHLLGPVVTRVDDVVPVLDRLVVEMEQRDLDRRSEPRVVIVLDELADLIQVGGRAVEAAVTRLTQRGREAGLHVVACTQKPAASAIGSLIKSNFPVRLVGSVASPEDAKVATGLAGTGAERLMGQGDFVVVAKGQVTRMQAAYIDEGQVRELVGHLEKGSQPRLGPGPQPRNGLQLAPATGTDGVRRRAQSLRGHLRRVK